MHARDHLSLFNHRGNSTRATHFTWAISGLSTTSMVFTVEKTSLSATMVSQPFSLEILREIQNTMPMSHIKGVLKSRLDILCGSKRFRFSLLFLPCYLLTVLIYRFMKDWCIVYCGFFSSPSSPGIDTHSGNGDCTSNEGWSLPALFFAVCSMRV